VDAAMARIGKIATVRNIIIKRKNGERGQKKNRRMNEVGRRAGHYLCHGLVEADAIESYCSAGVTWTAE
jgi:hypothetical protein